MKRTFLTLVCLALSGFLIAADAPVSLQGPAARLAGQQILSELSTEAAASTIRGARELWTDVDVETPPNDIAFANLKNDLLGNEVQGQLLDAGLKVMDPEKRSWAVGLRPTLILLVLRAPERSLGNNAGFYLVMVTATQDVKPMGSKKAVTLTTWCKTGAPIAFSGDDLKDIEAIRASARACVGSFIDAVQGVTVSTDATGGASSKP